MYSRRWEVVEVMLSMHGRSAVRTADGTFGVTDARAVPGDFLTEASIGRLGKLSIYKDGQEAVEAVRRCGFVPDKEQ